MAFCGRSVPRIVISTIHLRVINSIGFWSRARHCQRLQQRPITSRSQLNNHFKGEMNGGMSLTGNSPPETSDIHPTKDSILSPPLHLGMKNLDKTAFTKEVTVPTVFVSNARVKSSSEVLKPYFLKLSKFRSVQEDSLDSSKKRVYLNPDLVPISPVGLSEFLQRQFKMSAEEVQETLSPQSQKLNITYDNWRWWDLLDSIIPHDFEKARSFTTVGNLIHLNLRDHLLPYKTIIGQVLLDGLPNAKTVVNKVNTIDTTYRNFQMEVLAGDPSTMVKVRECGTEFEFDFATVYWNSRLSSEHERILNFLNSGDVLFDVFAGVGPFSLPAAKKRCFVYANDLNPESHRWLVHNLNKTKKAKPYAKTYNMDGRQFILGHLPSLLLDSAKHIKDFQDFDTWTKKIHVTMNLPALAVDFLDSFWGLVPVGSPGLDPQLSVVVHVYCFIKADVEEDVSKTLALELVKRKLRYEVPAEKVLEVFYVRKVAPNKDMLRVSFLLPNEILTCHNVPSSSQTEDTGNDEKNSANTSPPKKRLKVETEDGKEVIQPI